MNCATVVPLLRTQARDTAARLVRVAGIEPGAAPVSLIHPPFERLGHARLVVWWKRHRLRQALRREFATAPGSVLADFGLTRGELDAYVARPFWRP